MYIIRGEISGLDKLWIQSTCRRYIDDAISACRSIALDMFTEFEERYPEIGFGLFNEYGEDEYFHIYTRNGNHTLICKIIRVQ